MTGQQTLRFVRAKRMKTTCGGLCQQRVEEPLAALRLLRATRRDGSLSAFTIVELLVVIAIIGVLLALALPAIHHVRANARTVECKNRLKQVGLALHGHQNQWNVLPQDGVNGYGVGAFLLPYLEQTALYNQIGPVKNKLPDPALARAGLEDTILPIFRCPSHYASKQLEPSRFGRSDFLGTNDLFAKAMALTDVHDGESNTIAVGETTTDHAWALPGTGSCGTRPNGGGTYGSEHSGGANFVFCDGAVRFVKDSIDAATFKALGTPRGKEPVGEF